LENIMAMLSKVHGLLSLVPEDKRDVALAGAGMVALLAGQKLTGIALFAKGAAGLEKQWRVKHPEFQGGMKERWAAASDFYAQTHAHPMNRKLHMIGIPLIVGGTVGLLAAPRYTPPWFAAAGSFAGGWVFNFIGHGVYEKNAPAFADDPLSFIAGPVWDVQQVALSLSGRVPKPAAA